MKKGYERRENVSGPEGPEQLKCPEWGASDFFIEVFSLCARPLNVLGVHQLRQGFSKICLN